MNAALLDQQLMREAILFARQRNPVWPFAAIIADANGKVLVRTTDCAHISPLYHAEALAIHVLAKKVERTSLNNLTLYTTAECDSLSFSAIYWAQVTGLPIRRLVMGASLKSIMALWTFGIRLSAITLAEHSQGLELDIKTEVLAEDCEHLFEEAKYKQQQIGSLHPGRDTLSLDVANFYQVAKPD